MAVLLAVCCLGWLGWLGIETRNETRVAEQRAVRVAELRGSIAYLDEWLTMSAQMAALSGEARWIERYNEALPRMKAAIAEAVELATPEVSTALAATTDEASRDLTQMIGAALKMAGSGDRDGARSLLDSPEFSYLKAVYASGIDAFGADLTTYSTTRAKGLNDRAWMELSALGLGLVFVVAASLVWRGNAGLRRILAQTETMARTDPLTGLPNRRRLYEELQLALPRTQRDGHDIALLLLDLDRFKLVNDVHGHLAGDELLRLVAARLQTATRGGDLIARLAGDEFAIVAPYGTQSNGRLPQDAAADLARDLAKRIVSALTPPFSLPCGVVVQIGVSIGVALARGAEADAIMVRADVALYQAKADGRGRFHMFEPGMEAKVRDRSSLENDLRDAIGNDEIIPHFQPLVGMRTGRIVGFEMLARWTHPIRGAVAPAEFIPVAEEIGIIGSMTDRLLRRACAVAKGWPDEVTLACNISSVQLRDRHLPAMVQAALQDTGLPADRLELEITESAIVGDLDLARELLLELNALGVRLALDDFGTGYSSLRHLQRLPFDKLKIDAGFVGAMSRDHESHTIVAAVIGLGHSLGLQMVAEGVEEQATAELLRELGCDIGQGWLFGRPGPADTASSRLQLAECGVIGPTPVVPSTPVNHRLPTPLRARITASGATPRASTA